MACMAYISHVNKLILLITFLRVSRHPVSDSMSFLFHLLFSFYNITVQESWDEIPLR